MKHGKLENSVGDIGRIALLQERRKGLKGSELERKKVEMFKARALNFKKK